VGTSLVRWRRTVFNTGRRCCHERRAVAPRRSAHHPLDDEAGVVAARRCFEMLTAVEGPKDKRVARCPEFYALLSEAQTKAEAEYASDTRIPKRGSAADRIADGPAPHRNVARGRSCRRRRRAPQGLVPVAAGVPAQALPAPVCGAPARTGIKVSERGAPHIPRALACARALARHASRRVRQPGSPACRR
jgi:hypothetical protein